MRIFPIVILSLAGAFLCLSAVGQKSDTLKSEKKLKIIPLPAIFYTPETRLGFGGLLSGVFNLGEKSNTRNSTAQVLAAYTLNKQILFETKHTLFTKVESYSISGKLNYYDFPILYYGIGNNTDKDQEENLEYQVFEIEQRVLKLVRPYWFVGPQYRFVRLFDLTYEPEFLIEDKPILESQTGSNSGFGFSVIHDTRDNILNSHTGRYLLVSSFFHGGILGGAHRFDRYTIDYRQYFNFNKKGVLAFQYFGEFNTGSTPFREMALLGGDAVMRGYYKGRFRDHQQMVLQAEYRRQLIPWLGFTVFSSVGDVSSSFNKFDLGNFKHTIGGGLRVMINKADRLNIRIDYGFGKETSGFYFAVAEAF